MAVAPHIHIKPLNNWNNTGMPENTLSFEPFLPDNSIMSVENSTKDFYFFSFNLIQF